MASRYCKESESLSGSKNEEGSEMKVKGEYMGRKDEMILEVTENEQNKRLVTEQKEGPFNQWKSIQIFEKGNGNNTHVRHVIDFELPTTGNFQFSFRRSGKEQDTTRIAPSSTNSKTETRIKFSF